MLGSVPDFNKGSVVAVMMLLPSIVSIALLRYLEKYNVRYQKISVMELPKNRGRDKSDRDFRKAVYSWGKYACFLALFEILDQFMG